MFALGFFVYFQYTIHSHSSTATRTTDTTNHHGAWELNLKWLGGYPSNSSWYSDLIESAKVVSDSTYAIPLEFLFLVVAIAVKTVVFSRLLDNDALRIKDLHE